LYRSSERLKAQETLNQFSAAQMAQGCDAKIVNEWIKIQQDLTVFDGEFAEPVDDQDAFLETFGSGL
jgi:hypothetical protein